MALFDVEFHSYFRLDLPSPEVICLAYRKQPRFNNPEECCPCRAATIWQRKYSDRMNVVAFYDERSCFTGFHGSFTATQWRPGFTHLALRFNYQGEDAQRRSGSQTHVDGPILGIKTGTDYCNRKVVTAYERHAEGITEEEAEVICQDLHRQNQDMDIHQFMGSKRQHAHPTGGQDLLPLPLHPTFSADDIRS